MSMLFAKEDVVAMQTDLAALCEHVRKLMLAGKIYVSHRIKQLHGPKSKKSL